MDKNTELHFNIAIEKAKTKTALIMTSVAVLLFYMGAQISLKFGLSSFLFLSSFFLSTFIISYIFIYFNKGENIKKVSIIKYFTYSYILLMSIFINQSTLLLSNLFKSNGVKYTFEYYSIYNIFSIFFACCAISFIFFVILKKSKKQHEILFSLNSIFNKSIKITLILSTIMILGYLISLFFFSNSFNINYSNTIYTTSLIFIITGFPYLINDILTYIFVINEGKKIKTYLYFLLNKIFSSFGLFIICVDIII